MFANCLAKRLGVSITPSKALLERHVHALDQELEALFAAPYSASMLRNITLGGFVNVTLWLSWLQSAETFFLLFEDIIVTTPELSHLRNLPANVRMLEYIMLLDTKLA